MGRLWRQNKSGRNAVRALEVTVPWGGEQIKAVEKPDPTSF